MNWLLERHLDASPIGDDGCAYDVRVTLAGGMSVKNVGLHGMLERAELMDGRCNSVLKATS